MRKIMMFGAFAAVTLVAVATLAAPSAVSRNQAGGDRIDAFEMMKSAKDLPVAQFDAI